MLYAYNIRWIDLIKLCKNRFLLLLMIMMMMWMMTMMMMMLLLLKKVRKFDSTNLVEVSRVMACICYERQILAQMQMNESVRSVPPATEDEISALPVITITQAELGKRV